eukprot:Skav226894  [mRNA]  locus=scaffold2258:78933:84782:+ [translate_table: standard]
MRHWPESTHWIPWVRDLAVTSPWWTGQQPTAFAFFTDGSFNRGDLIGASVVLLVEVDGLWFLGGTLAQCHPGASSFVGEQHAITWALIWALQLRLWFGLHFPLASVSIAFHYDSQATGNIAAGIHHPTLMTPLGQLTRGLAMCLDDLCPQGFLQWCHVHSHQGFLWNEVADCLAKHALESAHSCLPPWQSCLDSPDSVNACAWLWCVRRLVLGDATLPRLVGRLLHSPVSPPCPPKRKLDTLQPLESLPASPTEPPVATFKAASANVLSLSQGDASCATSGARQLAIMKQFHSLSVHVVAIQESRHKKLLSQNNPWYHVFGHACDCHGHFGVQLRVHRDLPMRAGGRCIVKDDLAVCSSSAQHIVLLLRHPDLHCLLINVHAPHSGHDVQVCRDAWNRVSGTINKVGRDLPVILMCDSNGHLGSEVSTVVGPFASQVENRAGKVFHDWALTHHVLLPATFDLFHRGDSYTFTSAKGDLARIDYVGWSQDFFFDFRSHVAYDIDLALQRADHEAVVGSASFVCRSLPVRHRSRAPDPQLVSQLFHQQLPAPPDSVWSQSTHDDAVQLSAYSQELLKQCRPKKHAVLLKRHLQDSTWNLIQFKKAAWSRLKEARRSFRLGSLRAVFSAWHAASYPAPVHVIDSSISVEAWVRQCDVEIAWHSWWHDYFSYWVKKAVAWDNKLYLQSLAEDASRAFDQGGLNALWQKLKIFIPKHAKRRTTPKSFLGDALLAHFEALEAGTSLSCDELQDLCHSRKMEEWNALPETQLLTVAELPSRIEIESICGRLQRRRAPGPDLITPDFIVDGVSHLGPSLHRLAFKAYVTSSEPLLYKGGQLVSLHKGKGSWQCPASFRGILLAPCYAKVLHSWCRSRLYRQVSASFHEGQLGGLKNQQTPAAHHIIRLHAHMCLKRKLSNAVLFVDLVGAFHYMLRELVLTSSTPFTADNVDSFLSSEAFDLAALLERLRTDMCCEHFSLPPALARFLHDMHSHTWFWMQDHHGSFGERLCWTRRGSRPGSPLADLAFNCLMQRVLDSLNRRFEAHPALHRAFRLLGPLVPPVAWMDDLALPLCCANPVELPDLLQTLVSEVHGTFAEFGLKVNYSPGKSAIVLQFRGEGAERMQKSFFCTPAMPVIVASTPLHVVSVPVVSTYRHLGITFNMSGDLQEEITGRLGMTRQAYQDLSRPIFSNKLLPVHTRLSLLHSLVLSKFFYGAAIWSEVTAAQLRRLEGQLMSYHRRILNCGFWSSSKVDDNTLRAEHGLLPFRAVWARMRLAFLSYIATSAPPVYCSLLLMEFELEHGWLWEVREDLQWMSRHVRLPFELPDSDWSWPHLWECIRLTPHWKRLVNLAVLRFKLQSQVASSVQGLMSSIYATLAQEGFVFEGQALENAPSPPPLPSFICDLCEATFDSKQKLAAHTFKLHGLHSVEGQYVQSATCPGCLRCFWTSRRLQQHLRYRRNRCFDRVHGTRDPAEMQHVALPPEKKHIKRLQAFREVSGPIRPLPSQRTRGILDLQLRQLRSETPLLQLGTSLDLIPGCDSLFRDVLAVCSSVSAGPVSWDVCHGQLLDLLEQSGLSAPLASRVCTEALEHWLHLSPDADARECLTALLVDLAVQPVLLVERRLLHALQNIEPEPVFPVLPRHVAQGYVDRRHFLAEPFACIAQYEQQRKSWQLTRHPRVPRPLGCDIRLIVHLYSGRRRHRDFQCYVEQLLPRLQGSFMVLSIDTAVSSSMNVLAPSTWNFLSAAAAGGYILALLLGPPCESWSAARWQPILNDLGVQLRGPRPVRDASSPWGLPSCSFRELRQVHIGNVLMLRGLWLSIMVACSQGRVIVEHPSEPREMHHPSIWRTSIVKHLCETGLFFQHHILQFQYGAPSCKPTTFLCSAIDSKVLDSFARRDLVRPHLALAGKDSGGAFKTFRAKEYPPGLNEALAACLLCDAGFDRAVQPEPEWWKLAVSF